MANRPSNTKKGTALAPYAAACSASAIDLIAEAIGGEHLRHFGGVESYPGRKTLQDLGVRDHERLGEVAREQGLFEFTLESGLLGQVEQSMGIEGVHAFGLAEPVDQSLARCHSFDVVDHRLPCGCTPAVLRTKVLGDGLRDLAR